jgi:poly(hydroxyalkanoate) granule-associated protein
LEKIRLSPTVANFPNWRRIVSKQIKAHNRVKAGARTEVDAGRKLLLAGFGAVSIAQKLGAEWFDSMVAEGKDLRARSETLARTLSARLGAQLSMRLEPVLARVQAVRQDADARVEQGLGRALSYAGIPSKGDVDALIVRVDALARQLRASK